MIVGVDVDGVLADFNAGFIERVIKVTGEDKFPARPFDIPCWNYPQYFGYSEQQTTGVWDDIKKDATFWERLPEYPWTDEALFYLRKLWSFGHDVYFITSRLGVACHDQTMWWLKRRAFAGRGIEMPTVLISNKKGFSARALDLDFYIDDKVENCQDVVRQSKHTQVALFNQAWNQSIFEGEGVTRTDQVVGFCEALSSQP